MKQHYFVEINEVMGETSCTASLLMVRDAGVCIHEELATFMLEEWRTDAEVDESGWTHYYGGDLAARVSVCKRITDEEHAVMSRYLTTH